MLFELLLAELNQAAEIMKLKVFGSSHKQTQKADTRCLRMSEDVRQKVG